ncbi:hypothetical protein EDD80_102407 [Anseongella ginsenosidimutans]|uniref:Uncharacterized protein n=1 Tax=Anseongella ginsenosidimutans TaxID=496056 RepID=A0A4V2UU62_9SPHI|nr:hypothetical protein [Anseongella ginsenosidimutans]QEC51838.1 hypothetical protein FRZ59_05450 [Anseongella ginsenosidimutans]TCS89213.1 hypothetical protein EDD80_102407 [Anseongella ginsenosidimutans]
MFSTVFLLVFIGFYLQYNLSRKIKIRNKPSYLVFMERHVLLSRIAGAAAALLALVLLIVRLGLGSGIFGFGVVLMCMASLIVTLTPFRYLRWGHLAALYGGLAVFEIFIF